MNDQSEQPRLQIPKGRGSDGNPTSRFEKLERIEDFEQLILDDPTDPFRAARIKTEFFVDQTKSIVTENDSPDIGFRYSINPYRGCEHGCPYCYARPTHEYLGWGAGIDFESRILVKSNAAELLHEWLCRKGWSGERLAMSGVTDPYQPVERRLKVTRRILEVLVEFRQAVSIITKNALIERDLDLIGNLARDNLSAVAISLTTLQPALASKLEPRCSTPEARLRVIRSLRDAGVPVHLSLAPVIPGLNDHEMPSILEAASEAGAVTASMTMLRLPGSVEPVFVEWLDRQAPDAKQRVLSRVASVRGGKLNQSQFGQRMRGEGVLAEQIHQTFNVMRSRYGLSAKLAPLDTTQFRPPKKQSRQLRLF